MYQKRSAVVARRRLSTRLAALVIAGLSTLPLATVHADSIGLVDLGNLTDYLFFFANGSQEANWQGASKGFAGGVAIDGIQANEKSSGTIAYAGTITTNASSLSAWQKIVDQNAGQAFVSLNQTATIAGLEADHTAALTQIKGLTATAGYTSVSAASLDGLNTQNGIAENFVINVTSGFTVSAPINITGDATDTFILRWDNDANFNDGFEGVVKFQSGGCINPLGGLTPANFVSAAGDISSSGGGTNCSGLTTYLEQIDAINGGTAVNGGGFFTGYWVTTGNPGNGDTQVLSNAIFVGGWYTSSDKFNLTSGTSGVHVAAPVTIAVPEPGTLALLLLGTGVAGWRMRRRRPAERAG